MSDFTGKGTRWYGESMQKTKKDRQGNGGDVLEEPEAPSISSVLSLTAEDSEELSGVLQTKNVNEIPVLIGATILGKQDVAEQLITEGSLLECVYQGLTPYLWAIVRKQGKLLELYEARGADMTVEDEDGNNVLMLAVKSHFWNEREAMEYYNQHRSYFDANHKNKVGRTASHLAVDRHWRTMLKILLEEGADIDDSDASGRTSLMLAASANYSDIVLDLLHKNADLFVEDENRCTALCHAVRGHGKNDTSESTNIILDEYSESDRTEYMVRRLQIMTMTWTHAEARVVEAFLAPAVIFFFKSVPQGLSMLINCELFQCISRALKDRSPEQADLTTSILGMLASVLVYCDCCVCENNPTIRDDDLHSAFLSSQCPDICLRFLKESRGTQSAACLPLLLISSSRAGRRWLQDHFFLFQPYYQTYTKSSNRLHLLKTDDYHIKIVKKRLRNCKSFMLKLNKYSQKLKASEKKGGSNNLGEEAVDGTVELCASDARGQVGQTHNAEERIYDGSEIKDPNLRRELKEKRNPKDIPTTEDKADIWTKGKQEDVSTRQADTQLPSSSLSSDFEETLTQQVDHLMNSIFSTQEEVVFIGNLEEQKQGKAAVRKLTPTFNYLQTAFSDLVVKHRRVWMQERLNNYPGHKTPSGEDACVFLMKMKIVLPQLEEYHLNKLTEEWKALMANLQSRKWRNNEEANQMILTVQNHLDTLARSINTKAEKLQEEQDREITKRKRQNLLEALRLRLCVSQSACSNPEECSRIKRRLSEILDDINTTCSFTQSSLCCANRENYPAKRTPDSSNSALPRIQGTLAREEEESTSTEINTIFFNECFKPDSSLDQVSSSTSVPEGFKHDSSLDFGSRSRSVLSKDLKRRKIKMEDGGVGADARSGGARQVHMTSEIANLNTSIWRSHIRHGDILLPDPLVGGKVVLPYSNTTYFDCVELGMNLAGHPVAVKHIRKLHPPDLAVFRNVADRIDQVSHKNLLRSYIFCGIDPILATPLMEFNLGQFIYHLKTTSTLEVSSYQLVKQVFSGLQYLHTREPPIVHGNLKPSNIFVDTSGTLKIAEFGMTALHEILYKRKRSPPRSMIWWPGEVITAHLTLNTLQWTRAGDVAAAGMLVYFTLTGGKHPFGEDVCEIVDNLVTGKWTREPMNADAADLVSPMLSVLQEARPTIDVLTRHVFFWNRHKRWAFIMTCAGLPHYEQNRNFIMGLHSFLDTKIVDENLLDWKRQVQSSFPWYTPLVKEFQPSLTGLLDFIRTCLKEELSPDATKSVPVPGTRDIKEFFLSTFPLLPYLLYRLLQGSHWIQTPIFGEFNQHFH